MALATIFIVCTEYLIRVTSVVLCLYIALAACSVPASFSSEQGRFQACLWFDLSNNVALALYDVVKVSAAALVPVKTA